MKISAAGIKLIKNFEGCRLTAYKATPQEQYYTIGYGHYGADVKKGQTITQEQADNYLKKDLEKFENYVNTMVKLRLNQNQFDALVSFTYNCGPRCLKTLVHNRDYKQIAEAILLYNKQGGKVLKGLVNRRYEEKKLFETPPVVYGYPKVKVTAHALNVRAENNNNAKIVRVLNRGDIVSIFEESNGWGKMKDGWIFLRYTEKA